MFKKLVNSPTPAEIWRRPESLILRFFGRFTFVILALMFVASTAMAQITVLPTASNGWTVATTTGGQVSFAHDASAPAGNGALRLQTINDNNSRARFQYNLATPVSIGSINDMAYRTKVLSASNLAYSASYTIGVLLDGTPGSFASFNHEPYWQNGGLGDPTPVVHNIWQNWDVDAGLFWASRSGGFNSGSCVIVNGAGGPPFYSLADLKANCPSAVVTYYAVYIGSYNPELDVLVDLADLNGQVYDFEPNPVSAVYNSMFSPLAPNYASLGFEATSTDQVGDYVTLGGTNRLLQTVSVTMSNWALQSTSTNVTWCTNNPGKCNAAGFKHPITLNIYNNSAYPGVGSPIATLTQEQFIPWRPEADITCATPTAWRSPSDNLCYNGYAFDLLFDMSSSNTVLPDQVIVGVAYNTFAHGDTPLGVQGPYDSLNVSVQGSSVIGTDVNTDRIFWDTLPVFGGDDTFKEDAGWTPYGTVPFKITALPVTRFVDQDGQVGPNGECGLTGTIPFLTINAAITASSSGDIINVCPGNYPEDVTLNKSLTLSGAQAGVDARGRVAAESIITPVTAGITLSVGSAGAVIDGFTISGGARGIESASGPLNNLLVSNNRIIGFTGNGVFLNDPGTDITFNQNVIDGGSKIGPGALMHLDTDSFNGFHFTNNNIVGKGVTDTSTGFFVDGNHNVGPSTRTPLISGNLINACNTGMNLGTRAFGSQFTPNAGTISNNTFSNNNFDGLQGGIQNTLITGNTFSGNGRSGLALTSFGNVGADRGGQNSLVMSNYFTNNGALQPNGAGISFSSSQAPGTISTNQARFNRIVGNTIGVFYAGAETIDIQNNWWGCNTGPGGAATGGCAAVPNGITGAGAANVDADPWLVLTTMAATPSVLVNVNDLVTSSLTTNSDNNTPGGGFVPNGTPAAFATSLAGSTVAPSTNTTSLGSTSTYFASPSSGVSNVSTTIDGQTVSTTIAVYNATCVAVSIPSNIPTLRNVPVTVPINVDLTTGRNILGYVTTITYDSSKLGYLGIVNAGTLSSGFTYTVDSSVAGTLQIFAFGDIPLSGAGTLLNLSFQANSTISSVPTPVTLTSFDFNESNPCSVETSGSVTIISGDITGRVTFALNGAHGVPNIAMNATGTSPAVTTNTDYTIGSPATWGDYTLTGFGSGPYTVTPAKAPQPAQSGPTINGITPQDSACIAQWGVGQICSTGALAMPAPGTPRFRAADVTKNGTLSPLDAAYIAQFSVNTPNPGFAGTWEFIAPNTAYSQLEIETGMSGQNYTAILLGDVTGNWSPAIAGGMFAPTIDPALQKDAVTAAIAEVQAAPGTPVSVPITISDLNKRGVTAYQFDVIYDARVLEPMETSAGVAGTLSDGMSVVFNRTEAGLLRVAVYGVSSIAGDGTLITLNFRAIGGVGTVSTMSLNSLVLNEGGIPVLVRNGQVSVASAEQGTIRGRLLTASGQGVVNARVNLTSTTGEKRSVLSTSFGAFEFGGLTNGETYTVTVNSKRYTFSPRTVSIAEAVTVLDIIAEQ